MAATPQGYVKEIVRRFHELDPNDDYDIGPLARNVVALGIKCDAELLERLRRGTSRRLDKVIWLVKELRLRAAIPILEDKLETHPGYRDLLELALHECRYHDEMSLALSLFRHRYYREPEARLEAIRKMAQVRSVTDFGRVSTLLRSNVLTPQEKGELSGFIALNFRPNKGFPVEGVDEAARLLYDIYPELDGGGRALVRQHLEAIERRPPGPE